MKRLIAIDPGETVGWCVFTTGPGHFEPEAWGNTALKPFALELRRRAEYLDGLIYETFVVRGKEAREGAFTGSEMPTVQLIGMIRLVGWEAGLPLIPQQPKDKTTALMSMVHDTSGLVQRLWERQPKRHDDAHYADAVLHAWAYHWEHDYTP